MRSKNMAVAAVVVVVLAMALFGTLAYGVYTGIQDGQRKAVHPGDVVTGHAPGALSSEGSGLNSAAAPSSALNANLGIAQPAPGAYSPGGPPFGGTGGVAADGISAWGVAYKEVDDASAQADSALIKAAYQDAEKNASDLASATGNKLGKLVALTDYTNNQPYFKPCVQSYGGPPLGAPVPQGKPEASGSGSPSSAGTANGSAVTIARAPCQASSNHYLVVWVYVRHAL